MGFEVRCSCCSACDLYRICVHPCEAERVLSRVMYRFLVGTVVVQASQEVRVTRLRVEGRAIRTRLESPSAIEDSCDCSKNHVSRV